MPLLFIIFPLAGIILLNLPYVNRIREAALRVGIVISLLQIAMSLTVGGMIWSKVDYVLKLKLVIDLRLNSFSAFMLLVIGLVAFIALIILKYSGGKYNFNFSNLILLGVIGMNGVVTVCDLFSLYVFLEITAVSAFILIAIHRDSDALEGSFKYLVMSTVATVFILLAIALIYMSAGSLRFDNINRYICGISGIMPLPVSAAIVLLITGFSVKAGLVPFHGWLPDAYTSAPSAVSIFLAGIVTKIAGVYSLLIVFNNVFNKSPLIGNILMIFGAVSIVIGALAAIGQNEFKRMLAYSSISQIGYIILGIGIGTRLAIFGAIFHFFNHAVFKSLLFVNSAAVEMETGTRKFDSLGGLASRMPITGITSIIGFLSTAGIPPLSGFWSKVIIIIAAWQAGAFSYSIIALLASILTLGYFLKLQRKVFFGEIANGLEQVSEANTGFRSASIILSAITIIAGVLFPFIYMYIDLIYPLY